MGQPGHGRAADAGARCLQLRSHTDDSVLVRRSQLQYCVQLLTTAAYSCTKRLWAQERLRENHEYGLVVALPLITEMFHALMRVQPVSPAAYCKQFLLQIRVRQCGCSLLAPNWPACPPWPFLTAAVAAMSSASTIPPISRRCRR